MQSSFLERFPVAVRNDLQADPKLLRRVAQIYKEIPDGKGRKAEVTTPHRRGSRRHPW